MEFTYFFWALALGGLSALSLPLGSVVGLKFDFKPNQISILAAFGAGALLAALSVELIAPTTMHLVESIPAERTHNLMVFFAMIVGCVFGGGLYVALDYVVNQNGGFSRKTSTLYDYYKKKDQKKKDEIIEALSQIEPFHEIEPSLISLVLPLIETVTIKKGTQFISEEDEDKIAYLILEGEAKLFIDNEFYSNADKSFGFINLFPFIVGGQPLGKVKATSDLTALKITADNFKAIRNLSKPFSQACDKIALRKIEEVKKLVYSKASEYHDWADRTKFEAHGGYRISDIPFLKNSKNKKKNHEGSPMAVWLGILLDGIPESLVIGAGMMGLISGLSTTGDEVRFLNVIPYALIAGLFLSNFPEALSSSANMKKQGMGDIKVFMMWFALMVMTAIGAGVGYSVAGYLDHTWVIFLEGLAAGAMLTMIAAAMIPEAVLLGKGNSVGLSVLAGFLAALLFKLLE